MNVEVASLGTGEFKLTGNRVFFLVFCLDHVDVCVVFAMHHYYLTHFWVCVLWHVPRVKFLNSTKDGQTEPFVWYAELLNKILLSSFMGAM